MLFISDKIAVFKIQFLSVFALVFIILLLTGVDAHAYTFDWKGSSTTWASSSSWIRTGSGGTSTYPGQSGSVDIVRIGVSPYTGSQPTLAASASVASIEFGDNSGNSMTFTINNAVTLTVTGTVKQDHSNSTSGITTTLTGLGTAALTCASFTIGDTTMPPAPSGEILFGGGPQTYVTTFNLAIPTVTVNGNITLNTTSSLGGSCSFIFIPFTGYNVNNVAFNLNSGALTANNIVTTNSNYVAPFLLPANAAVFQMGIGASTNSLTLLGATPVTLASGGEVDFFSGGTASASTVTYAATVAGQRVYSSGDSGIGSSPTVYGNLIFSGASAKTAGTGTLSVGGDFTTNTGSVNLSTNSTVTTVTGNWINNSIVTQGFGNISVSGNVTNSGTLTLGTGSFTMSGNYTNNGTYTQSTGYTVFNGFGQTLKDAGFGTMFNNVIFNGNGGSALPDVLSSGNFSVSSTGSLTMQNATYLNANGHLTLNSDVNSSANVAAIPLGAAITGIVNVQRFIQGSAASTVKRGYRLITSTVYTGTVSSVKMTDFKYLTNSVPVSGLNGTANGFNVTSTTSGPTIYLFREDLKPPPSNATNFTLQYNWKGVSKINNTNSYDIGVNKRLTTTNANDTTTNIPVGNGVLFFFRGDKTHNVTNKTTAPYAFPEDVTTTQTGTLNTGTINVKMWFANAANALGTTFSYTAAYVNSGTSSLRGGYALVGNPYASTINWEKYNRNATVNKSSIYGTVSSTIWVFNENSKQYQSYMQKTTTLSAADTTTNINPGTATGSASNMIASGQGFFVKATGPGQTLSFRETAKVSTQPVAATLHNLMGVPKSFAAAPDAFVRLRLVKDTINTDEIVVKLDDQASNKYVEGEDAEDLGGMGALESLSAFSADSIPLAIDATPYPGKQAVIVPLLVDATESGAYTLVSPQVMNLPSLYTIWLKDGFTHDSLLMKTSASYAFNIDKNNPATFGNGRFTLVIRQDPAQSYALVDFNATKVPNATQVQLVWNTVNEQSYTNFTVEHSTDGGKTFTILGGMHSTGAGNYSLLDKSPIIGQNFYRLKQEDLNNTVTYSNVVQVDFSAGNGADRVRVYPNPATSTINVAIASDAKAAPPYVIMISSSSGRLIKQVTSPQANWQNSIAGLLPGTYIVKVFNNADSSLVGDTKFVKL